MGFFPLFLLQGAPPLLWITPLFVALHKTGLMPVAVSFLVVLPLLTAHISAARSSIKPWEQDVFKIYNSKGSVVARELYLPLLPSKRFFWGSGLEQKMESVTGLITFM